MVKLILLLVFIILGYHSFSQEDNNTMPWNASNKLEWKDYKGTLNPEIIAYASTSYKIDIIPENVIVDLNDYIVNYQDLTVVANFYKNHSWTVSNDVELLNHERLHFDIAELFARKIRKRFSELKNSGEKRFARYQNEYNALWQSCRVFQKKYDSETNHGAKKNESGIWYKKVAALLENFKNFAST
ncbi:hypothetical protein GCM10023311_15560 [Flaviramulus aquimarinus]|uniref:DUF922 domain-containing protein n=1 Tax=Flaviramulus aquimarinus TaxID=1170456 RepID=A0ABP9F4R8_9FLAO